MPILSKCTILPWNCMFQTLNTTNHIPTCLITELIIKVLKYVSNSLHKQFVSLGNLFHLTPVRLCGVNYCYELPRLRELCSATESCRAREFGAFTAALNVWVSTLGSLPLFTNMLAFHPNSSGDKIYFSNNSEVQVLHGHTCYVFVYIYYIQLLPRSHGHCHGHLSPPTTLQLGLHSIILLGWFASYHPKIDKRLKIMMSNDNWLVVWTPLKILVNWDDYSQYMGNKRMFQTTNQYWWAMINNDDKHYFGP